MVKALSPEWLLIGRGGPLMRALADRLSRDGITSVTLDVSTPRPSGFSADLHSSGLTLRRVVILPGAARNAARRPWTYLRDTAVLTARLLPLLTDRAVTLASDVRADTATKDLSDPSWEAAWTDRIIDLTAGPHLRDIPLGLADAALYGACLHFASSRPDFETLVGAAARLQERILRDDRFRVASLRIVRLPEIHGGGQETGLTRALRHGALSGTSDRSQEIDGVPLSVAVAALRDTSPGVTGILEGGGKAQVSEFLRTFRSMEEPLFIPSIEVVHPPLPEAPVKVYSDIQTALETGVLREGPWSAALRDLLSRILALPSDREVILTNSGTSALRLACTALVPPRPGITPLAVVPSYTFAATAEFLEQLGFRLAFCDVDPETWTLDPRSLERLLERIGAALVVSVDALGNPADYDALNLVCSAAGVPLLSDSAPALGALYRQDPVGTQADAHAFSFSFAKLVSAAGAGGFAVVQAGSDLHCRQNWARSSMMGEPNAVMALDQARCLDALVARRQRVAAIYAKAVHDVPEVSVQRVAAGNRHSYVHWVLRIPGRGRRDAVAQVLERLGVHTKPYYAPALHDPRRETLPATDALVSEVLALPTSSEMTDQEAADVGLALRIALRSTAEID